MTFRTLAYWANVTGPSVRRGVRESTLCGTPAVPTTIATMAEASGPRRKVPEGGNSAEVTATIEDLADHYILLRSLGDGIDTSSPAGPMIAGVQASLAEGRR